MFFFQSLCSFGDLGGPPHGVPEFHFLQMFHVIVRVLLPVPDLFGRTGPASIQTKRCARTLFSTNASCICIVFASCARIFEFQTNLNIWSAWSSRVALVACARYMCWGQPGQGVGDNWRARGERADEQVEEGMATRPAARGSGGLMCRK